MGREIQGIAARRYSMTETPIQVADESVKDDGGLQAGLSLLSNLLGLN